jgi:glucose-1-phosphatase
MIRNIIFDLGNVLISFRPSEYLDSKNYPNDLKSVILTDIFRSSEWKMLDNGEITTQEAIDSIALKSSLKRPEIARIFDLRTELMFPLDNNVKMLPGLRKRGYSLYFLSNFPIDIFDKVKEGLSFFSHFNGGLISAEVRASKPAALIYKILIDKYALKPEECLFVDDIEANVDTAESLGMKGLVTYGSPEISSEIERILNDHRFQHYPY